MTDEYKGMTHTIVDLLFDSASQKRMKMKNTLRPDDGPREKQKNVSRPGDPAPDKDGSNLTKEGEQQKVDEAAWTKKQGACPTCDGEGVDEWRNPCDTCGGDGKSHEQREKDGDKPVHPPKRHVKEETVDEDSTTDALLAIAQVSNVNAQLINRQHKAKENRAREQARRDKDTKKWAQNKDRWAKWKLDQKAKAQGYESHEAKLKNPLAEALDKVGGKTLAAYVPKNPHFAGDRFELRDMGTHHAILKTHQDGKSIVNQWGGLSSSNNGEPKYIAKRWKALKNTDAKLANGDYRTKTFAKPYSGKPLSEESMDEGKYVEPPYNETQVLTGTYKKRIHKDAAKKNPVAAALASPHLKPKVVKSKKLYNRKKLKAIDEEIAMTVPLFIRMLEFAKEDAKTDMDLHKATENIINLHDDGKIELSMDDYDTIVNLKKDLDESGWGDQAPPPPEGNQQQYEAEMAARKASAKKRRGKEGAFNNAAQKNKGGWKASGASLKAWLTSEEVKKLEIEDVGKVKKKTEVDIDPQTDKTKLQTTKTKPMFAETRLSDLSSPAAMREIGALGIRTEGPKPDSKSRKEAEDMAKWWKQGHKSYHNAKNKKPLPEETKPMFDEAKKHFNNYGYGNAPNDYDEGPQPDKKSKKEAEEIAKFAKQFQGKTFGGFKITGSLTPADIEQGARIRSKLNKMRESINETSAKKARAYSIAAKQEMWDLNFGDQERKLNNRVDGVKRAESIVKNKRKLKEESLNEDSKVKIQYQNSAGIWITARTTSENTSDIMLAMQSIRKTYDRNRVRAVDSRGNLLDMMANPEVTELEPIHWPKIAMGESKKPGWFIKATALFAAPDSPAGKYAMYRIAKAEAEDAQDRADARNDKMIAAMRETKSKKFSFNEATLAKKKGGGPKRAGLEPMEPKFSDSIQLVAAHTKWNAGAQHTYRHEDGSKTRVNQEMGKRIYDVFHSTPSRFRSDIVEKMHGSADGLAHALKHGWHGLKK